jgi:hypothetical protein
LAANVVPHSPAAAPTIAEGGTHLEKAAGSIDQSLPDSSLFAPER